MSNLEDSSISDWINFNGTLPGGPKPCQWYGTDDAGGSLVDVNCSQVCNYSVALLSLPQTSNLVTCGQWSFLMNGWATATQADNILPHPADALKPFQAVGLEALDITYNNDTRIGVQHPALTGASAVGEAVIYADLISSCLLDIYLSAKSYSTEFVAGTVPTACTTGELFNAGEDSTLEDLLGPMTSALRTCLGGICAPRNLNTDLAGIGVSNQSALTNARLC